MDTTAEFESHRPRPPAVAYRMPGMAGGAEDVVQDAYPRWSAAERETIRVPAA
ncbi:hypothetical protein ACIOWG_09270 [Streptomyces sp. NPDC087658]|uniref:hypothetical protein n=1 Tax=Streptomyces sp. NPDC087658 TaxID=3365800 RepID=UPI0037FA5BC6